MPNSLKAILFFLILISIGFIFYKSFDTSFNFDQFNESSPYNSQIKSSKEISRLPLKPIIKDIEKSRKPERDEALYEYVPDDKAIKSCNLILKSKLSIFKKLNAFLSSPCREVAGQKVKITSDEDRDSLNWLQFYQLVNIGMEKFSVKEKQQIKTKVIAQLANPGNLIQTSILSDVLITMMKKTESVKAQELEKLIDEMSAEVEYLGNISVGSKADDPIREKVFEQETQAISRFQKQFRLIMDIK